MITRKFRDSMISKSPGDATGPDCKNAVASERPPYDSPMDFIWITRERTTVRHLRGLVQQLDAADALPLSEIRILAIPEDDSRGVRVRNGAVWTYDTLPA